MFGISIRNLPKLLSVIILFISIVLLGFLLIGCLDTTSQYSKVYLAQFQFNQTSIDNLSSTNVTTPIESLSIKINYLGVCFDMSNNITCSTFTKMANMTEINGIPLNSSPNNQPNIVTIAKTFSNICHPRILIATLLLNLILLLTICYSHLPIEPGKLYVKKFNCIMSLIISLLWGLGAMLQQEAVDVTTQMVREASMYYLSVSAGTRAQAMTWTIFAFSLIVTIGSIFACFKYETRSQSQSQPQPQPQQLPYLAKV
ncbi:Ca2+ regulator and membrane fusion protein Fig1-domain-containing protein [Scheffersomyces amazonensis]|uniref:Ca2+ regulator and membrane fusion protein Fig1-domain-containing protein n=1 Tax=Scheffersomyces amazonensis TaxID=1078765 RepID=UPI00315DC452